MGISVPRHAACACLLLQLRRLSGYVQIDPCTRCEDRQSATGQKLVLQWLCGLSRLQAAAQPKDIIMVLQVWEGSVSGSAVGIGLSLASVLCGAAMLSFSGRALSEKLDVFR